MTLRCPCGCEISGNGDGERSRSFKEHLIKEHEQDEDSLRMLELREKLGEEVTKGLLAMEMEMRAHLHPSAKSWEEILADSTNACGGVCVTEFSMSKDQMEAYVNTITCPACGHKVGGDDDGELSDALREHCNGHEGMRSKMAMRALPRPR
jgi:predicted small metal-binding protein